MNKEKEYGFNFRGQCMGVEAESLESAYGYFYSTYPCLLYTSDAADE